MADAKISALTAAGTLAGTEQVPIVQSGATVRTTTQAIANLAAISASAVTLLSTTSVSAGEINVTGLSLTGVTHLLVVFHELVSSSDTNYLKMQIKDSGGNVTGNVYKYCYFLVSTGGSTRVESGATATDHIPLVGSANSAWSWGNATADRAAGQVLITNAGNAAFKGTDGGAMYGFGSGSTAIGSAKCNGQIEQNSVVTGIRIFGTSNLSSGTVKVYGYA